MDITAYLHDHLEAYRRGDREIAFFNLINHVRGLVPDLAKDAIPEPTPPRHQVR